MATNSEVLKVWTILCASYPAHARDLDATVLETTIGVYQRLLADVPADVLEAAALQHIASSRFFPTVAELREAAMSLAAPQHVTAIEAWGEVQTAIMRWDRYAANGNMALPEFSNPIIGRIVRQMGMVNLQDSDNEIADRARFIQAYEALVRRERDEHMLLPTYREKREQLAAARTAPALANGRANDDQMQRIGNLIAAALPAPKQ